LEAPDQIRRAVILLWISLGIGVFETALTFFLDSLSDGLGDLWIMFGVGYLFYAFLICRASQRKNWARVALLAITAAGMTLLFIPSFQPSDETVWWWVSTIGAAILDIVALYWLFFGNGAKWYSSRAMA
jgi:hypothetical protein